jgi:hypothetical protein
VNKGDEKIKAIVEYDMDVLDALAINNGPSHAEVNWCSGSACLIEVLRQYSRLGSSRSMAGIARIGSSTSVLGSCAIGSTLSFAGFGHCGSTISGASRTVLGGVLSVTASTIGGSNLSVWGLA